MTHQVRLEWAERKWTTAEASIFVRLCQNRGSTWVAGTKYSGCKLILAVRQAVLRSRDVESGFATEQGNRPAGRASGHKQKPCEAQAWQAGGADQPVVVMTPCESREERRSWVVEFYIAWQPGKTGKIGWNETDRKSDSTTRAVWWETITYGSVRALGWNSPWLLDYYILSPGI